MSGWTVVNASSTFAQRVYLNSRDGQPGALNASCRAFYVGFSEAGGRCHCKRPGAISL